LERTGGERISNEIIFGSAQFLLEKKMTTPILKMAATLEDTQDYRGSSLESEMKLRKTSEEDF